MMKKIFLFLVFCFGLGLNAQVINFPDANFKAKLLLASPTNTTASTQTPNIYGQVQTYNTIDTNGDGEIQVSEASLIKYLKVPFTGNSSSVSSLIGIANFANLQVLICNSNNSLTALDVSGLNNLKWLDCRSNQLANLNVNGLTSLVSLNYSFNPLPNVNISSLTGLKELFCRENGITNLNLSGLINIEMLDCRDNQLSTLNVNFLINLRFFHCSNNLLTSLNVVGMSNLTYIAFAYNQISSLDLTGVNLTILDCSYTPISFSSFTPGSLLNLNNLMCSGLQLTSIDFSLFPLLTRLDCSYNQLTYLDVSSLTNLNALTCTNNLLNGITMKNGNPIWYTLNFQSNPTITYICANEENLSLVQNRIDSYGYVNCHVNSYCNFTPGGISYTIQGNVKFDLTNNGCDSADLNVPNTKFTITNGSISGALIANETGNYSIPVQAGSHTISTALENPSYFTVSPTSTTVGFPITPSPVNRDFCLAANGVHFDLEITIVPIGVARPGFESMYKIILKNKGNQTQSGTLNFEFNDAVLDFVSSNFSTISQSVNNLTWSFTNLTPFSSKEILVTLNVNSPTETSAVNGGDVLSFTATIASNTDETPIDNAFILNQTVINSFDPNDKTCLEGETITPDKVGEYVHYLIRFENTGTANAQNIVVKDMIDTSKFDITTLVPIDGSHSFVTRITNTNQVEFIFENIQLPFDNATNDGYVAFKIKTKPTLTTGNSFSNTASIYFDYNFPIVTNTATTTIQALANQDFEFSNYFELAPNPAQNIVQIQSKNDVELSSISIYNTLGQLVLVIPNAKAMSSIDVSQLTSGTYFIKVISDKGSSNTKFIKE